MRIYIILGIIFFLGPTCNHRVLCELSDDEGSGGDLDDFYLAGEHRDTLEGSATGPYGPVDYDDPYDDTEPDYEDDDKYNYEEEIESGDYGIPDPTVYDKEDEDFDEDFIWEKTEVKNALPDDTERGIAEPEVVGPEVTDTETEEETFVVETPSVTTSSSVPSSTEMSGMEDEQVVIQSKNEAERPVSVFAQPGILAAFIGGAVVGLLCAILLVMFIVYRMRKKDEGSYPLDEPKRMPLTSSYSPNDKEIYA